MDNEVPALGTPRSRQQRGGRSGDSETAARPNDLVTQLDAALEELSASRAELRTRTEEIRSATRQIAAERAHYQELFDAAPDAYITTDLNGVIRDANRAAAHLTGTPPAALTAKPLSQFIDEEDRAEFRAALNRLARYETVPTRDIRIVSRDGTVRTVAARAAPVSPMPGQDPEIRWILRDITDRVRAEEALRMLRYEQAARQASEESERRALFLAEASRSLLGVIGVDATIERIIQLAVPGLGEYATLDLVQPDGRLRRAAVHHVDERLRAQLQPGVGAVIDPAASGIGRVLRRGESEVIEHPPASEGGSPFPARLELLLPLRGHDRTLGVLTVGRGPAEPLEMNPLSLAEAFADRAAAALEHALLFDQVAAARRAAERANEEKARFLSVLSHEIRTPLSATLGYVELMLAGIPEPLPPAQLEFAQGIHASVRHQLGIVDQILQFASLQRGPRERVVTDVDIGDLLEDVANIMRPSADVAGLDLDVEVDGPIVVRTDEGKLRQAILNITNNAVRFTEQGGIRLRAERDGETVVIRIADTGPGIPPEDIEHVFETFWRGPAARTRPAGMGLGLAITRELIDELEGEISVNSTVGVGTEFTIRLGDLRNGRRELLR